MHFLLKDQGSQVFCAPGNAGISQEVQTFQLDATNPTATVELAIELAADLVVIGPEAPLVAGVADALREAGFSVFGPSAAAAQLEGRKAFAKEVMAAAGVPTAVAHVCSTEAQVRAALDEFGATFVVKDDGLAAGKGVVVTDDYAQALEHALACINSRVDGAVVIEEFLAGPEVSLFGVTDGKTVRALSPAQDFKRVFDNDDGPNTGGMGAYSPLPWLPAGFVDEVTEKVARPTIMEMARLGAPFVGLLYCGLIVTERGIRVIEFNARFGDPETQVVLRRLTTPLSGLLYGAATGNLTTTPDPQFMKDVAVTVVLASEGYPDKAAPNRKIHHIAKAASVENVEICHAATAVDHESHDHLIATGGRVLSVVAVGSSFEHARRHAYEAIGMIELEGSHFRKDIATKVSK